MEFEWFYEDSTVESVDVDVYGNYTARDILDNPLADLPDEELLHIPAHELHEALARVCNSMKPTLNVSQPAACTQIGRVRADIGNRNVIQVVTKPSTRIIDGSEYMVKDWREYGLDLEGGMDCVFEIDDAPNTDIDIGAFTATGAARSDMRDYSTGPITNALSAAAEFIADLEEEGVETTAHEQFLEGIWGGEVKLRATGLVPQQANRSTRRRIAERFKTAHYIYGNEGQISQFVAATASSVEIKVPDGEAIDHHRLRYLARLACFLDYYSTSSAEKRSQYQNLVLHFGVRVGQSVKLKGSYLHLNIPDSLAYRKYLPLPGILKSTTSTLYQFRLAAKAVDSSVINPDKIIDEIGSTRALELVKKLTEALGTKRNVVPGFEHKAKVPAYLSDLTYDRGKVDFIAFHIPTAQVMNAMAFALLHRYDPGKSGELDGKFRELKVRVEYIYTERYAFKEAEIIMISHRLADFAAYDIIAVAAEEMTKATAKKVLKSDVVAKFTSWIARKEIPTNKLNTFSKPWIIAMLLQNKEAAYYKQINYHKKILDAHNIDVGVKIPKGLSTIDIVNEFVRQMNRHIAYYVSYYRAKGQVLRDLRRVNKDGWTGKDDYKLLHASRFLACVKYKVVNGTLDYDINSDEAFRLLFSTAKNKKIFMPPRKKNQPFEDYMQDVKEHYANERPEALQHIIAGYNQVIRYLVWRNSDFNEQYGLILSQKIKKGERARQAIEQSTGNMYRRLAIRHDTRKAKDYQAMILDKANRMKEKHSAKNPANKVKRRETDTFSKKKATEVPMNRLLPIAETPVKNLDIQSTFNIRVMSNPDEYMQAAEVVNEQNDVGVNVLPKWLADQLAAEMNSQNQNITDEDRVTDLEAAWAFERNVELFHVIQYDMNAVQNGTMTLDDKLKAGHKVIVSDITGNNPFANLETTANFDIYMG